MATDFDELNRMARDRGERDFERAVGAYAAGHALWKNNPHQNNHATEEALHWEEGWEAAARQHLDEHRRFYPIKDKATKSIEWREPTDGIWYVGFNQRGEHGLSVKFTQGHFLSSIVETEPGHDFTIYCYLEQS